jgi:hypothetical protein
MALASRDTVLFVWEFAYVLWQIQVHLEDGSVFGVPLLAVPFASKVPDSPSKEIIDAKWKN